MKTNKLPSAGGKRRFTSLGAIVFSAYLAASASGQVDRFALAYTVTELGVLPGKKESFPTAINNAGQVAGISAAGDSDVSAFRYDPAKKVPLEELGRIPSQAISRAFAINSAGVVVGDSSFGPSDSVRRAALFTKGVAADLGTLKEAGEYSRANGINASGQVVGFAGPKLDHTATRAFIWTADTGMLDIGTLGGPYAKATAINEAGFVTGHSVTFDKENNSEARAFLYQPLSDTERLSNKMRDLGTLGGSCSYGTAINAHNHVVGHSTINDEEGLVHAFLFDGGKMQDLGSLGEKGTKSDQSVALGINSVDQVVGYTFLPDGAGDQVGFLYDNGVMRDLNTLIGRAARRYLIYSATAINDEGEIVASAFDYRDNAFRAVLLKRSVSPTSR